MFVKHEVGRTIYRHPAISSIGASIISHFSLCVCVCVCVGVSIKSYMIIHYEEAIFYIYD